MDEGTLHFVKLVLLRLEPPASSLFLGQACYRSNTSLLAVWDRWEELRRLHFEVVLVAETTKGRQAKLYQLQSFAHGVFPACE